jgi:predicted helicase
MSDPRKRKARIFYARVDEFWRKEEKYAYLDDLQDGGQIEWQELQPDAKHNWLTGGLHGEFETLIPIGTKAAKAGALATASALKILGAVRAVKPHHHHWLYV